jgi:DNA-binding transcriptional LysR family regulator
MTNKWKFGGESHERRISPINFIHLRYAVVAADEGSFRRAAEILLVRQSTLSRSIRQLENVIGISIFDRSSAGVSATPSGASFLIHARSVMEQLDTLLKTSRRIGRGETDRLSIGFYTSLSSGNLLAAVVDFRQRFPDIALGMTEKSRTHLMTALRNGTLDVAIVTGEVLLGDGDILPLWSERTLIALPEGHPLADRKTIYWTDLRGETVLLSQNDQGSMYEDLLTAKLLAPEDRPRVERHDVTSGSLKCLISVGAGVGLVTESDIGTRLSGLIYRELHDGAGSSCVGYSALWKADNDNPALAGFLKLLTERYPSPAV